MISKEELIEFYFKQELSHRDIGKKLGCSETPVKYALKKYGLKSRTKSESCKIRCIKKPQTNPGRRDMPKKYNYGKEHHGYKGGFVNKQGYRVISIRGEQRHEHRYVWEKYHNKLIPEGYQIHHIDGDKLNNKIENIKLIKNSEHQKLHNQPRDEKTQRFKKHKI